MVTPQADIVIPSDQTAVKTEVTEGEPCEIIEESSVEKIDRVICSVCSISLSSKRVLKRHMMSKHVPKPVATPSDKPFKCDQCSRQFGKMKNLTYHKKKEHKVMPEIQQRIKPCPICRYICSSRERAEMDHHLHMEHGVDITPKELTFPNFEEFLSWKENLETESQTKYVVSGKGKEGTIRYYACHRSGFYDTKGKGVRRLKSQGSKKINSYCPAYMKAVIDERLVIVRYLDSHVGHDNDLIHLPLSTKDRESIATMITSKLPLDFILEGVRETTTNEKRMHLLKKKDLYNISKEIKSKCLGNSAKPPRELTPEAWIVEMKKSENHTVFIHKPSGVEDDNPLGLENEDEILIIMVPEGYRALKLFGQNCVCLDQVVRPKDGYYLVTLLVQDEARQGIPTAICVCSKLNFQVAAMFMESIRSAVGILGPSVLLCDQGDILYSAWCSVMTPPVFRLVSRWHVLADWKENLSKIESELKRTSTYNTLAGLLEERDSGIFYATLTVVTDLLACDDGTSEFARYLVERYKNTVRSWASCHRTRTTSDAAIHMERVHGSIEKLFLSLPLWSAIMAVVKFINDRTFDRNAKRTNMIASIRSRHRQAENMVTACVTKNDAGWEVSTAGEVFQVERTLDACNCQHLCSDCNACPHLYTCRCEDSYLRWNMCRHIHLVCSCIVAAKPSVQEVNSNSVYVDASMDSNIMIEVLDEVNPVRTKVVQNLEGLVQHAKTCPAEQLISLENLVDQVVLAVTEIKNSFSATSNEMETVTSESLMDQSLPILD